MPRLLPTVCLLHVLIPKTNPFLRQIFNNLAGNDLDERIAWVVDDLVTVFLASDLQKIMKAYGEDKRHHDPMIHFYEDFLSEYNPKLRKSKGVWYTPQPVVGFIVRAVDEILQKGRLTRFCKRSLTCQKDWPTTPR